MTIFGTPAGTPLNNTGFQGTQPGNPVGVAIQPSNPGVGMFPPGSDNRSGDTALAAMSRGAVPANIETVAQNIPPQNTTLLSRSGDFGASGYNAANGGVYVGNNAAAGGAGPGAGGANQTPTPSGGSNFAIPVQAPAAVIAAALPGSQQFGG